jgi:hypothetical protein
MYRPASPPVDGPWGAMTRIEVDASGRVRSLRSARRMGSLGTAVVGLALLGVSLLILRGSGALPPLIYFGFVGGLLVLAPGWWFALTLTLRRLPDRVAFDETGLTVHFPDGRVREIAWADPAFAVDLLNLGHSDFTGGTILLASRMKGRSLDVAITPEGVEAFRAEAERQGLHVEAREEENPRGVWGVIEIRRAAAGGEPVKAPPTKASRPTALPETGFEYGQ